MDWQLILVIGLLGGATLALVAAFAVRRLARRSRESIAEFDVRLDHGAHAIRRRLVAAPQDLVTLRRELARAAWTLEGVDVRLEAAATALAARRRGSDTLREQLLADRARLSQIRDGARVVMRAIELRRELLG